jgi:hypothetical protein
VIILIYEDLCNLVCVQNNELRGLPEEAKGMTALEELLLDRCPFTTLPDVVAHFKSLRILSIQNM